MWIIVVNYDLSSHQIPPQQTTTTTTTTATSTRQALLKTRGRGRGGEGKKEVATFAGGCFWCMQPPFHEVEGVINTGLL